MLTALGVGFAVPAHGAPTLSPGCTEANEPQYDGEYPVGTIGGLSPAEILTITAISSPGGNSTFHVQDLLYAGPNLANGEIPGTVLYTIPTTGQLIRWGIVVGTATWTVSCEAAPSPPSPPSLETVRDELEGLVEGNAGTPLADKAEDVAKQLDEALAEFATQPPDVCAALGKLEGAAGDLEAMGKDELLTEAKARRCSTLWSPSRASSRPI